MTNREKAIADLTEWLKSLNNERLAYAVANTYIANFTCKHCIYILAMYGLAEQKIRATMA